MSTVASPLPPEVRRLYPFEPRWLDVDGLRMHYVDEGPRDGPPLLFVHGNPTWGFLWRRFVADLAREGYRCIAPDHVGFGLSDKPGEASYYSLDRHVANLQRFVEALGLRRPTFLLHDWGGPIGLGAAVAEPANVARVALLDTWCWVPRRKARLPPPYYAFRAPGLGEFLARRLNLFVALAMRYGVRRRLPPDVLRAYRWPFPDHASRAGVLAFPRMIPLGPDDAMAPPLRRIEQRLPDLRVPALLVWARHDIPLPPPAAKVWQKIWPHLEGPHWLEEAGHFLQEDAPEAILAHLRPWLARTGSGKT